jgi:uncharacterized protein YodC (DUF2158 family)
MNDHGISEGDAVHLKSGGPLMSVQSVTRTVVVCMWFDPEGKLQERAFPASMLRKAEQNDGKPAA